MSARWEIARHDTGYTARFKSANNRTVVSSEVYVDRRGAVRGIESVVGDSVEVDVLDGQPYVALLPVIDVDERTAP